MSYMDLVLLLGSLCHWCACSVTTLNYFNFNSDSFPAARYIDFSICFHCITNGDYFRVEFNPLFTSSMRIRATVSLAPDGA